MKFTEVVIKYSRTLQMRQFEPLTIDVTAKAQVDPGDDAKKVIARVQKTVREQLDDEVADLMRKRKESFMDDDSMEKTG